MAPAPIGISQGFSAGRIFSRAFQAFAANPVAMLMIALICGALPNNGLLHLETILIFPLMRAVGSDLTPYLFWPIGIALGVFIGALAQGAMTPIVVTHSAGGHTTLGSALLSGLTALLPLILLAIFLSITTVTGLVLAIVPGVFVLVTCSVAASALIEERNGVVDALYRSFYLTKGVRLRIFGVELVLTVLGLVATALISTVNIAMFRSPITNGMTLMSLAPTLVINTLLYAFVPAVKAALYVELREWKEGPQTDTLAEVFA